MKILIISQYFYPESFKINDVALGLKERGHHVAVLTGIPNYPVGHFFDGYSTNSKDEIWSDIKIYRSKIIPRGKGGMLLLFNYFSFAISATFKLINIKERFDAILVYEPSPVTVGIPAIFAKKKFDAPYYFWVQDLWPESLTAAGGIKNKYVIGFFYYLTKLIYRHAKKILVQSKGFKSYITDQGVNEEKILFYPNSTEEFYKPQEPENRIKSSMPKGFCITFAGNLGEAQSLSTVIDAAQIVKEKGLSEVKWVFLGDGRQRQQLQKYTSSLGLNNEVYFLGAFPSTEMPKYFACSDVLISSLKKDRIFSLTIPSKIQSYLASGKPILASMDGEGAQIIQEASAGYSSPAEDAEALAENVLKLFHDSADVRFAMSENGLRYFKREFERNMLIDKLVAILKSRE